VKEFIEAATAASSPFKMAAPVRSAKTNVLTVFMESAPARNSPICL